MILVDTNVVSEFMRPETNPAAARWASTLGPHEVSVSVITVQEIEHGIRRLPDGSRKNRLRHAWESVLPAFADTITAYELHDAVRTAQVLVAAEQVGRPMSLADAQIAGICLARGWALATRNTKDFTALDGLTVIDPFQFSG